MQRLILIFFIACELCYYLLIAQTGVVEYFSSNLFLKSGKVHFFRYFAFNDACSRRSNGPTRPYIKNLSKVHR